MLLAVVAVFLIDRNRRFLVGEAVRPEVRNDILARLMARDDIDRITYLHLEFLGPSGSAPWNGSWRDTTVSKKLC